MRLEQSLPGRSGFETVWTLIASNTMEFEQSGKFENAKWVKVRTPGITGVAKDVKVLNTGT